MCKWISYPKLLIAGESSKVILVPNLPQICMICIGIKEEIDLHRCVGSKYEFEWLARLEPHHFGFSVPCFSI